MATFFVGGATTMERSTSAPSLPVSRYSYRSSQSSKRRFEHSGSWGPQEDNWYPFPHPKRTRVQLRPDQPRESIETDQQNFRPAFFVLRETRTESPAPTGAFSEYPGHSGSDARSDRGGESHDQVSFMVRTSSGIPVSPAEDEIDHYSDNDSVDSVKEDERAATLVEKRLADQKLQHRDSRGKRILRSLICPKKPSAEYEYFMDNEALQSVFSAANDIFFGGRLRGRVTWEWSDCSRFQNKIIGTTALRKAAPHVGGYETLIVLSQHYLRNPRYSRRLLISTFLHELIHCYLFVSYGFSASECGGHTKGFRRIATLMDDWVGRDILFLRNIEADLGNFLKDAATVGIPRHPVQHGRRHHSNDIDYEVRNCQHSQPHFPVHPRFRVVSPSPPVSSSQPPCFWQPQYVTRTEPAWYET